MNHVRNYFNVWLARALGNQDVRRLFGYVALSLAALAALLAATTTPLLMVQLTSSVTTVLWLLLLLAFYRGISTVATCHWGCLISLIENNVTAWYSGGVYSSVLGWMGVLVLASYFVVGRKAAVFWVIASISVHSLQAFGAQWLGIGPVVVGMTANQAGTSLADYSLIFLITVLVMLFYHRNDAQAFEELLRRQGELQSKREDLERELGARDRFIASVSHELRTPMNAILGLNSYLKTVVTDKPGAMMVLDHTSQAADHLMTIINDVLDYTQFKSGQLQPHIERVQLHAVLQSAFGLFKPRIASSNLRYALEIAGDVPQWMHTDKHRLTQILVNLLGNAIKFTESGQVLLQVSRQTPDLIRFTVRDTGIGISEQDQQRLFSRFSQANPSIQKRFGGSGLGLLISQRLVQLLGGNMGFESQAGRGSTFWFTLPLNAQSPTNAERSTHAPLPSSQASPWRLLIVDDHPINRLLLRQVLLSHWPGATVHEAADGHQALALVQHVALDLVLMDMVMVGMDGIEATQAIRATPAGIGLPILGLTANIHPPDLASFKAAGLDDITLKPFERTQLLEKLETMLAARLLRS